MKRLLRHFVFGMSAFAAGAAMADVTFFESENFGGRQFTINQPVANFADSRVNDRAKSAIVDGGAWEICVDAEFRGDCRIFVPGRYPNLGGLGGRVSSARLSQEPRGEQRAEMRGRAGAAMADVTFFETENFGGRQFKINQPVANFARSRLNDRARSATSTVCSTTAHRRCGSTAAIGSSAATPISGGECRTFGPGEYAVLPPELDKGISSGRRISNEYPYSQPPNWR